MKLQVRVLPTLLLAASLTLPPAVTVHARPVAPPADPPAAAAVTHAPPAVDRARILESFGRMPLYFVENRGQMDEQVAYYVQGADNTLYFTNQGVTFALTAPVEGPDENAAQFRPGRDLPGQPSDLADRPAPRSRWSVRLEFVGASPDARPVGEQTTGAVISYFKGPQTDWHAGLATYSRIVYRDLWPGIDLAYNGTADRLKYEFLVSPGADPGQIRLAYHGATGVELTAEGQLQVTTPAGGFTDDAPVAYQEVGGERVPVAMAYAPEASAPEAGGPEGYGFALGHYDPALPLVLDPAILVYCGYIGGNGDDEGWAIEVDGAGNAYVSGLANSAEATFPVTVGPDLTHNSGWSDAFVAKVRADGTSLVYAGYIGGSGDESASAIAVDSTGNASVTGYTGSTEATFPAVAGPDLTYNGGSRDVFVAKVEADGTGLIYAGYIGGSGSDQGSGIAVDSTGNAYVAGYTGSTEGTFPVVVGPHLSYNGGSRDAFVAKIKADGTGLVYAGYIGGSGDDRGYGIALDWAGNAYCTGRTDSTEATFPVIVGPDLTYNSGSQDVFVAKVEADGTGLIYAGYIGGSGIDESNDIAVDSTGNAYVTGYTGSTEATFPVAVGPDLTYNGGYNDAFVATVRADGAGLVYAGYIGGSGGDNGYGVAIDRMGCAYIAGYTSSDESTFPATVGPDLTYNGGTDDAFVAMVRADGTGLVYAGYIGGSGEDVGLDIAVDGAGNVYVTGLTASSEPTFPVAVGPDLTHNGGPSLQAYDAFVAKVPAMGVIHGQVTAAAGGGPIANATVAGAGTWLSFTSMTSAGGFYSQTLWAANYSITATAPGFLPAFLNATLTSTTPISVDVQLVAVPTQTATPTSTPTATPTVTPTPFRTYLPLVLRQ